MKKFSVDPGRLFLVCASFIGLLLLFLTPPFQVPDEFNHFYRAYQVSEGKLLPERLPTGLGGHLPVGLGEIAEKSGASGLPFHPEQKIDIRKVAQALGHAMDDRKRGPYVFTNTALYSPLPYLPQAVGISLARMFCPNPLVMFYAGRLFNLVTFILVIFLAIRIAPVQKRALAIIGLMPMVLFLAASLSSDVFTIGATFLFFAVASSASLSANSQASRAVVVALLFLAVCIGQCKAGVYIPLVGSVLMIPPSRLAGNKKYWLFVGTTILLSLLSASLWLYIAKSLGDSFMVIKQPVGDPLRFIVTHPLDYLGILYSTFCTHGYLLLRQFGGILGWLDTPLPKLIGNVYLVMLFIGALIAAPGAQPKISVLQRLVALLVTLCVAVIVSTAVFANWPQENSEIIFGLQGRYFIPLAPYFLLMFCSRRGGSLAKYFDTILTLVIAAMWVVTFASLFYRYYATSPVASFWRSLGVYSFGF